MLIVRSGLGGFALEAGLLAGEGAFALEALGAGTAGCLGSGGLAGELRAECGKLLFLRAQARGACGGGGFRRKVTHDHNRLTFRAFR